MRCRSTWGFGSTEGTWPRSSRGCNATAPIPELARFTKVDDRRIEGTFELDESGGGYLVGCGCHNVVRHREFRLTVKRCRPVR